MTEAEIEALEAMRNARLASVAAYEACMDPLELVGLDAAMEAAHQAYESRLVHSAPALLKLARERVTLPVIAHCGECRHLDVSVGTKRADFVCRLSKRNVFDEPARAPRKPPVPPAWCEMRGRP